MLTKVAKLNIGLMVLVIPFISSCATVFGGSKYKAEITVHNNQKARIIYQGKVIGEGTADLQILRKDADKVVFKVVESGCEEQSFAYKRKSFRTGGFIASLLLTPLVNGFPVPLWVIVDAAAGSYWKPDVTEGGVNKIDYKYYEYKLFYDGCKNNQAAPNIQTPYVNIPPTVNVDSKPMMIVYLLSGKAIRGEMVSEEANVSITIKTSDGSVQTFKMDEIEKIKKVEN